MRERDPGRGRDESGKLLWDVLIVLLLVGIVVAIAIPSGCPPNSSSNETSAIASLRNLASCQHQVHEAKKIDQDGDGVGEYGTFAELSGSEGVRMEPDGSVRGSKLVPPILSPAYTVVAEDGTVTKSGYFFRIFLPGPGGTAVHEGPCGAGRSAASRFSGPMDADLAEKRWCAYAWPVQEQGSGQRAFFVDQDGDVWWTKNEDGRYWGTAAAPAWDAAMSAPSPGVPWAAPPKSDGMSRSRDGNAWKIVN